MIASLGRLPDPRFMLEVYFIEPYIFGYFIQTVVSFFKRSLTKDREPGRWTSSVSGHVNSQEDYDTAMHREIPEEIGVPASTCKDFQKVKQFPASQETDQEFVWLYQAVHPGPFQPDPHEVASLDWFFPAQINQMLRDQPSTFSSCLRLLWNQRPR